MAATWTQQGDEGNMSFGPVPCSVGFVTPDTSYPTGGYALTAAQLNCGRGIVGMSLLGANTAAAGYVVVWNTQTSKLQIYVAGTPLGTISAPLLNIAGGAGGNVNITTPNSNGSALANGTAGSALTGLTGIQAPTFTGTAGTKGSEVGNGTNLSTLTFTFLVVGQR